MAEDSVEGPRVSHVEDEKEEGSRSHEKPQSGKSLHMERKSESSHGERSQDDPQPDREQIAEFLVKALKLI